jgi:mannonate dehydratase
MEQTWRWFGPEDAIRLPQIRQTGATGIVTALHHIPYGVVWSTDEISKRRDMIAADPELGLRWSVVESLPVSEAIKLGEGDLAPLFENYRQSIRNLAGYGVTTVCYNFIAVLDWTRTELPLCRAAERHSAAYAAFDCCILERAGAEADHLEDVLDRARAWIARASDADKSRLLATIMAGLPGAFDHYDVPGLRRMLAPYRDIGHKELRANNARFLREVVPAAEECGVWLCVHPDGPRATCSACRAWCRPRTTCSSSSMPARHPPTASPSAPARSARARRMM